MRCGGCANALLSECDRALGAVDLIQVKSKGGSVKISHVERAIGSESECLGRNRGIERCLHGLIVGGGQLGDEVPHKIGNGVQGTGRVDGQSRTSSPGSRDIKTGLAAAGQQLVHLVLGTEKHIVGTIQRYRSGCPIHLRIKGVDGVGSIGTELDHLLAVVFQDEEICQGIGSYSVQVIRVSAGEG